MISSKTTTTIVPLEATTVVDTPTLASREYHPHHPPNRNHHHHHHPPNKNGLNNNNGRIHHIWKSGRFVILIMIVLYSLFNNERFIQQYGDTDHDDDEIHSNNSNNPLPNHNINRTTSSSSIDDPPPLTLDHHHNSILRHTPHTGPVLLVDDMSQMHSILCRSGSSEKDQEDQENDHPGHVLFRDGCGADSTGNMLGYIFLAALYAGQYHRTFQLDCTTTTTTTTIQNAPHPDSTMMESVQARLSTHLPSHPNHHDGIWYYDPTTPLLPIQDTTTTTILSTKGILPPLLDACQTLQNDYPHKYRYGLQYMAPLIRTVLRQAFPPPPNRTTTTTTTSTDDVVIHIRCGDVLKYAHHTEYGYPRYEFYRQTIHNHFWSGGDPNLRRQRRPPHDDDDFTIGIVTASWDLTQCRPDKDCDFIDVCRDIILDVQSYLIQAFPMASAVRIYSQDTTVESYARIIHAALNICNPSTFCVYPAMAALGVSYIVASEELYPFVEELPWIYDNIHVAHVEFLNMAHIDTFRTSGLDLVTAITQWARGGNGSASEVAEESSLSSLSSSSSLSSLSFSFPELGSWTEERSSIEMIQEEFIVLNHVCLTNGEQQQGPYEINFFAPNDENDGKDLVRRFQEAAAPYSAWDSDLKNSIPLEGTPSASYWTDKTLRQFVMEHHPNHDPKDTSSMSASMIDGTTLIAEPHHPDNNFHLHNDLIIPALYKIIKSGTKDLPKEHPRTLLLTHGCQRRYEQRVVAFDVVLQLFDHVRHSLEQILQEPLVGGVMCFERVIMGGRSQLPYYSHRGRFGDNDRWKGVLPDIRDWVNTVYGIHATRSSQRREWDAENDSTTTTTTSTKPQLTFVDRPCEEHSTRCLRNTVDVIRYLSKRFDVHLLSFPQELSRSEQFLNMLQRMASTDILVGMHGAGLGHTIYLQPGTLLVEMKDGTNREKKLFLNMANLQDIGYYYYDVLPASRDSPNTILSDEAMESFTEELWLAWEQEQEFSLIQNISNPVLKGECLFPQSLDSNRPMLSSFSSSRCYLEQAMEYSYEWFQCAHYNECALNT